MVEFKVATCICTEILYVFIILYLNIEEIVKLLTSYFKHSRYALTWMKDLAWYVELYKGNWKNDENDWWMKRKNVDISLYSIPFCVFSRWKTLKILYE